MKRCAAVLLLALPLSQLGHGLVYWLRYGRMALPRQTTGAHAYFPSVVGPATLLLAGTLLASLLLIGLSRRLVALRGAPRPSSAWPLLPLVLALCLLQVGIFAAQELGEGISLSAAVFAYGLAGQTPVAIAGALALSWLSVRVLRAVRALRRPQLALANVWARAAAPFFATQRLHLPTVAFAVGQPRRGPPLPPPTRD